MEGTAWDTRRAPPPEWLQGLRKQPGLILGAAWVGGSVEGCPWRFFGDHRGAPGGVRACEHGSYGWGMARGVRSSWFEARAWGALSGERGALGLEHALGLGWLPWVVHGDEGLRRAKSSRR
jgi:hypothetical protein